MAAVERGPITSAMMATATSAPLASHRTSSSAHLGRDDLREAEAELEASERAEER